MMMFWWAVATTLIATPMSAPAAVAQPEPVTRPVSAAVPEIMTLGWVDEDDAPIF